MESSRRRAFIPDWKKNSMALEDPMPVLFTSPMQMAAVWSKQGLCQAAVCLALPSSCYDAIWLPWSICRDNKGNNTVWKHPKIIKHN